MEKKSLVVVNPNAGKRKGAKDWKQISLLLKENGINYKAVFTYHRLHAIQLTQKYIARGYRKFIVIGGDGTLHEVINGIMTQNVCPTTDIYVGIVPVGTGNDWAKTFNVSDKYNKAISTIKRGKIVLHDVGVVSFNYKKDKCTRYIINSAGIGFESVVVEESNNQKDMGRRNPFVYIFSVMKYFFSFKGTSATMEIDGETKYCKFYACSIGICQYKGKGIRLLPHALHNDGKLAVTIIKKVKKTILVRNLIDILKGDFKGIDYIESFKCNNIKVDSISSKMSMEVDGESLGNNPYEFKIVPLAVNMIINEIITEK